MLKYIIITLLSTLFFYCVFLVLLKHKIKNLENDIIFLLNQRINLIPCLYEISNEYLEKHEEIFKESLKLRKINFVDKSLSKWLYETLNNHQKVHNELNFIFRVCNKHQKLTKKWNFVYIRELIIDRSLIISRKLDLYKKISQKTNKLISIKNYSIIWLFIPISKIDLI